MAGNQHNDWGHSDVGQRVPDQGGVGFTGKEGQGNAAGVPAGDANRQSEDPGKDAGASNGQAWRPDVPDQSGVGFTPEDGGNSSGNTGGQNRQSAGGSGSTSSAGINTNFQHASPESNVNPPGAPQNSHGSATGPLPGGVEGQYQASRNAQAGMGAAAAGGNPGTTMGNPDASDKGIHGAGPDGGAPAGNGSRQG